MKHLLFYFTFSFLIGQCIAQSGESKSKAFCRIDIIRLDFDDNVKVGISSSRVALLPLGKITSDTLLRSSDIESVFVNINKECCEYAGYIYSTTLDIEVAVLPATRLKKLDPPLCCGIPVLIMADGVELLRAYYWNSLSSHTTGSLAIVRNGNKLKIFNQFPLVRDSNNYSLIRRLKASNCFKKELFDY